MQIDLTGGQFRRLLYYYKAAKDLISQQLYKEARVELSQGLKLLESSRLKTPLLAKYYLLYNELYAGLNNPSKALHYKNLATETARACGLEIADLEEETLCWIDPLD